MVNQVTPLPVVLGCMTFGEKGKFAARVYELDKVQEILDEFSNHGHTMLDTAATYGAGTSEQFLGKLGCKNNGFEIHTKIYPTRGSPVFDDEISHDAEGLRQGINTALQNLKVDSIDLLYLHAPDRSVPFEETFKELNNLHKEGKFKRLGISNYMAWEVAEVCKLCKANGWIAPSVYQGVYNGIHRSVEPELFPCLDKFGISFYAFNPLSGGFLTGRYVNDDSEVEPGSRFDQNTIQGKLYRNRYWKDDIFKGVQLIEQAVKAEGLTMPETALRFLNHHSKLSKERGDAIIIGASSLNHIKQNLDDLEKGPLPQSIVDAYDKAWNITMPHLGKYWH